MFSHSSAQETSKALQDNLSLHSAPSRCYQWGLKPCQLRRFEHQSTANILFWSPASWGKYVRTKGGNRKTLGMIVAYWHLQQDFPVPFHSVTYKMGVSPCSLPPRFISLLEVILLASGWLHGSHVSFPKVYSLTSPRRWLPLAKRFGSSQQPLLMSSQNGSSKNPDWHWFCPVVFFVLTDSLSTLSLMPSAGTRRTLFCRATSVKTLGFFSVYIFCWGRKRKLCHPRCRPAAIRALIHPEICFWGVVQEDDALLCAGWKELPSLGLETG